MAISLQKGGNVNLSKEAPGLSKLVVGLGWDVRNTDGSAFDIDSTAFLLKVDGKVRSDADFIFYNNLKSVDGSVQHSGDNRTGAGDGDDETVTIELGKVPPEVDRIAVCVTIHEADARRQNFGQVNKAFVRCVNAAGNTEIARFDLSEDGSVETSLVFGEVYRNGADWKFRAVGQGYKGGLGALAGSFGVAV
ncbi:TerD family protein [Pseudoduganella namucuonensis]|uniref:Tellurium resistance protein TerD n=1 Tax=Pseudoduganella namucuonensis TaxID=1035707 RepID=A0A1I7EX32_9BURK|nr:TerD family protein [Pseudoduganella namucuonensis]SFU28454.1 tellurium resistance protein TerD [Pseudoduganella namucuonensis]